MANRNKFDSYFRLNHIFSYYFCIILFINLSFHDLITLNSCPALHFELGTRCYPYLNCSDIKNMKPLRRLFHGIVKNIWLVEWNGYTLVMSRLTHSDLAEDFTENLKNLVMFQSYPFITRLFGWCGLTLFTKYYPLGDMNNLHEVFERFRIKNFKSRLEFCIQYVEILRFLHSNSMVMCDSNSLSKTLSQYLISDDLRVVLNDLDALPMVNDSKKIVCGPRELYGDFIAPEQLYKGKRMEPYDQKTDIWKIPDVCHWIIDYDNIEVPSFQQKMLNWIHAKCKSINPIERPSSKYLLDVYHYIDSLSY